MFRRLAAFAIVALALLSAAPVSAQVQGAERRAILDAMRPTIEQRLRGPVEFVVRRIAVRSGWALVIADPQRPGGGRIDGRRIFGEDYQYMDGLTVNAVLRLSQGRWRLVDHAIGPTDVWYCDPALGAPRALTGC